MKGTDPVLFPMPPGSRTALRQDIARNRADLAATIAELAGRFDVTRRTRRGVPAAAGGAVAAALGGSAGALVARSRGGRAGLGFAIGAGAGALAFAATRRASGPESGAVEPSRPAEPEPVRTDPGAQARATVDGTVPLRREGDVVDVLLDQHRQIREALTRIRSMHPVPVEAFAALVESLQRHERAEQELVHAALIAGGGADGEAIAGDRQQEEKAADRAIAHLINIGVTNPRFEAGLADLEKAVLAHAEAEEREEFPMLRRVLPADRRKRLANQVQAGWADPVSRSV
jgi:hypothetical protein